MINPYPSIADSLVSVQPMSAPTGKIFFAKSRYESNVRYHANKCGVCSWVTIIDGIELDHCDETIPCQYCNYHEHFVRFVTITTEHDDLDFEKLCSEWLEKNPDETEFYQTKLEEFKIMKYL